MEDDTWVYDARTLRADLSPRPGYRPSGPYSPADAIRLCADLNAYVVRNCLPGLPVTSVEGPFYPSSRRDRLVRVGR